MNGRFLLSLALLATCAIAQQPPLPRDFVPAAGKLVLNDGDTFVFVGDSITAQCLYTQYLEDFFYTRFPKTHVHFHNAGTMGDRAADALTRFEDDVAAFKPQYVSVLLGLNDGNFTGWEQPVFETFQKDMTTLLDRIAEVGAKPVLLTPTPFDPLANRLNNRGLEPRDTYYDKVMSTYGAWLKEQGKARQFSVADFHAPLDGATQEHRRNQSDWTIIPDSFHPSPAGHVLMAAAFINDVAFKPPVSDLVLSKKDQQWIGNGANGLLEDLQESEGGHLSFRFTAASLPWVLPPEAEEGRQLVKPALRPSGEKLTVRNLKPGPYDLKIDGVAVGRWTDVELAAGVELGENARTPQYQQALQVALLNQERNAKAEHPLRIPWAQLKGQHAAWKEAEEKENGKNLENRKKAFETWHETMQKDVAEFVARSKEFEEAIYQASQPVARKYELVFAGE